MSRKRPKIQSSTLLQARNQFLTNGVRSSEEAEESTPVEEQAAVQEESTAQAPEGQEAEGQEAEVQKTTAQKVVSINEVSKHKEPEAQVELSAEMVSSEETAVEEKMESPETGPLPKKRLLQQFLESTENKNDTMYLPHSLYKAVRMVWNTRKVEEPGVKKSHIIIEALLYHPEILAELRKAQLLK